MAGSRRGTADWHFATGHFGRKRAIRRRGRGAGGGGDAPAAGTGRVSGTAEEVRAEEERAEEEHRPLARGPVGDAGVPAAKRRGGSRKGKTPADGTGPAGGTDEPAAKRRGGGEKEGRRQRRYTGRWHGAGRQGGRGGAPAASARRVGGTAEEVRAEKEVHRPLARGRSVARVYRRRKGGAAAEGEKLRPVARRAAAQKKACAAAGPYPEVRTTLFIIGSVRRGYALQRRESSCRPT